MAIEDVLVTIIHTFNELPLTTFLVAVGAFTMLKVTFKALNVFLQTFIIPGISVTLKRFGAKQGAWAVVTGATDGIGKEFAFQLAKAGFHVVLVARNNDLLASTASELSAKYPESLTATHSIDFAKANDNDYAELESALSTRDVGVLVNNVGKSHNIPAYLVDTPIDEMTDIVAINVNATLRVTKAVVPLMIQKKRGLILNIGSFAGAIPSPMLATYSGTKAFLATFSGALGEELKQHNIVVELVNTYFVTSKLSKIRKPSSMVPRPDTYVRWVLAKIGLPCGAAFSNRPNTSTPFWSHSLLDYGMTLFGRGSFFVSYTHSLHKDIRRRALKKLERKGQ
ncbi:3-ketoacyl-CoA reductase [Fistulina hepatica ATCC 64428]|uniref:Very-long-chain 3-oxoacyl-CoA reductase n=1 Tax=Fistulina hepatica ATCC 64428 TaxID=1128425 RepID=A0A0D7AQ51_9AGAR|nr:3-ketoacyl-CoA reductase [Fistulina hepatica ATCC 64428]